MQATYIEAGPLALSCRVCSSDDVRLFAGSGAPSLSAVCGWLEFNVECEQGHLTNLRIEASKGGLVLTQKGRP